MCHAVILLGLSRLLLGAEWTWLVLGCLLEFMERFEFFFKASVGFCLVWGCSKLSAGAGDCQTEKPIAFVESLFICLFYKWLFGAHRVHCCRGLTDRLI